MRFIIASASKLLIITASIVASVNSSATIISLDPNSLPSAQGWVYESCSSGCNAPLESNTFTSTGGALQMDSTGTGSSIADYANYGIVDPTQGFLLTASVSVGSYISSSVADGRATSFSVLASTGTETFGFSLNSDTVAINAGSSSPMYIPLDSEQSHDYILFASPGSESIFVDGALLYSGTPAESTSTPNGLYIGKTSSYENGVASLTNLSFVQENLTPVVEPVPEATTGAMFSLGLVGLGYLYMRRNYRQAY